MDTLQSDKGADIAVVAALPEELAALRKDAPANCFLLKTGAGEANAERSLRPVLDGRKVKSVIHIGFAGALSSDLTLGDVVIARHVRGSFSNSLPAACLEFAARLKLPEIQIHFGTAITVSDILRKAEERRALAASIKTVDSVWVDMESAVVARICMERAVPFLVVRAITDLAGEDLPLDLNRCRTSDGDLSRAKVLVSALIHPSAIPKLLEMRRRSAVCAERLARVVRQLCNLEFSPSA